MLALGNNKQRILDGKKNNQYIIEKVAVIDYIIVS